MVNTTINLTDLLTFNEFPEYDAAIYVWTYVSPFLIFIGTMGSIMSILVLIQSKLHSITTTFYLIQLACSDILVLNSGLLYYWVKHTFGYNLRNVSGFACKVHTFLVTLFLDYSAWVLVMLTVDRCICACKPSRAMDICNMRNAKLGSVSVFLVLACVNMQFLITHDLVNFGRNTDCYALRRYVYFFEHAFMWIDFCVFSLIPFIIMITCNALIIRQLKRSSQKLDAHRKQSVMSTAKIINDVVAVGETSKFHPTDQTPTEVYYKEINKTHPSPEVADDNDDKPRETLFQAHSNALVNDGRTETQLLASSANAARHSATSTEATLVDVDTPPIDRTSKEKLISMRYSSSTSISKRKSRIGMRWNPTKLAVMLISINCVFLLLTSPIVIYQIGLTEWKKNLTPHKEAQLMLAWAVVSILQYADNTIHYFQYYMTVPTFRRVFKALMICEGKISSGSSTPLVT